MKITSEKEQDFNPIKLEITIETQSEFEYFWALANAPLGETKQNAKHPALIKGMSGLQMQFFEALDKHRS